MAWPTHVARSAPAMPSTVVRMKPDGLLGPGERTRARMPATKPTMMMEMMPPMIAVLSFQRDDFCPGFYLSMISARMPCDCQLREECRMVFRSCDARCG